MDVGYRFALRSAQLFLTRCDRNRDRILSSLCLLSVPTESVFSDFTVGNTDLTLMIPNTDIYTCRPFNIPIWWLSCVVRRKDITRLEEPS